MIKQFVRNLRGKIRQKKLGRRTPEQVFSRIYHKNKWRGAESRSGKGSDLDQTKILIEELAKIFRDRNITSVLDIPCGDFNWMKHVDLSGIEYVGADIVPDLIAANNEAFGGGDLKFVVCDLISDELPRSQLIFVRDCLVHLSFEHGLQAIENIKRSGATYLLTTTFPEQSENLDIATGEWRRINLQSEPYNFPEPIMLMNENYFKEDQRNRDKSLGLWKISDL